MIPLLVPCNRNAFLLLLLPLLVCAYAQPVTEGLVAYYPLDGHGQDASGNALHGTVTSALSGPDRFGRSNSALQFDGSSSFIDCGNPAAFNFSSNFTLSAWVWVNSPGNYIIAKYLPGSPASPSSYGLGTEGSSRVYGFVSGTQPGYTDLSGGPSLANAEWHAVALTYERSVGLKLFVDGASVTAASTPDLSAFVNSVPLMIGRTAGGQFFHGSIDEVRIYNRALSASEIQQQWQFDTLPDLEISQQPKSAYINVGQTATFTVGIRGRLADSATFQWFENDVLIPGVTGSSYTTPVQGEPVEKSYRAKVSSGSIVLETGAALLKVYPAGQEPGLLAHWSFDEDFTTTVPDKSGAFPGQAFNTERVEGRSGGAIKFNGTDAYILVGGERSPLQLTNTHYSLVWWQKWSGATSSHQSIIAMDDGADYSGGYQVYLMQGTSDLAVVHDDGVHGAWPYIALPDQNWRHYAVTFDGDHLHFYADGVEIGLRAVGGSLLSDGDDPLVLGALRTQAGNFLNFFNGVLDDVRIYARTLAPEEIAALGPEPEIMFTRQPLSYRVADGQPVTLSATATTRAIAEPVVYQWELNRVPIANASAATLQVNGKIGEIKKYRVLARAGGIEKYSDEVELVTIPPGDGKLLLHLDFENTDGSTFEGLNGHIATIFGKVNRIPGRTGNFALDLSGQGYLRIPAGGTELELVGTSYSIAWWMKTPQNYTGGYIYTLGSTAAANTLTGYAARLEGSPLSRALRSFNRNGQSQPIASTVRNITNWHHMAIVFNGVTRTVYTNGVAVSTVATAFGPIGSGREDLILGADYTGYFSPVGSIDDFRVYNYALASDEIASLVNVPLPAPRLEILEAPGSVMLRWPVTDNIQYRVEYSSSLLPDATWTPLSATVLAAGYYRQVTEQTTRELRFYRLRKL